eukprot:Rhum_TRINITY_DN11792_c0_g2::Rhum_TRINITY_DN11792_c0_g2_i1::g.46936::m.46936
MHDKMKTSDAKAPTTIRLFVARLPHDTTLEEVATLFDDTPGITDIAIRRTAKPGSWMSKDPFVQQRIAFIDFACDEDAKAAKAAKCNLTYPEGCDLIVAFAREGTSGPNATHTPAKSSGGRGGGGGGGRDRDGKERERERDSGKTRDRDYGRSGGGGGGGGGGRSDRSDR